MVTKTIPTASKVGAREGGSMKFGISPLGLGPSGVVDGSVPGGRASIAPDLSNKESDSKGRTQRELKGTH